MMKHEPEIRQFLADKFLFGDDKPLHADASLLEAGIIDSMGILELIAYLERHYMIKVNDDELMPENFDTIANICAYLSNKTT